MKIKGLVETMLHVISAWLDDFILDMENNMADPSAAAAAAGGSSAGASQQSTPEKVCMCCGAELCVLRGCC